MSGQPFLTTASRRLAVAGEFLVTGGRADLVFHRLTDGAPAHTFPAPGRSAHCVPFADDDGPGVLTVAYAEVRLWRRDGAGWRAVRLARSGPFRWPGRGARRPLAATVDTGRCWIWYADGVILRYDARTGVRAGTPERMTPHGTPPGAGRPDVRHAAMLTAHARRSGQVPYLENAQVWWAAGTGFAHQPVTIDGARAVDGYRLAGRDTVAVVAGRRLHRVDAASGGAHDVIEAGPRHLRSVAAAVVDGRPALFTADGETVRRWDAETATPWPAPIPERQSPAPGWELPLDGLDDAGWDDLLGPGDAARIIGAFTALAAGDPVREEHITDLLYDEDDGFAWTDPLGPLACYRAAAVPALRFAARIAAQPSGGGRWTAVALIREILRSEIDRTGGSGAEMDAMVDALRAELDAARPALAEAVRLTPALTGTIARMLADADAGLSLGGAYESRWRGLARPLVDDTYVGRLSVAGDMLVTCEPAGPVFRSTADGAVLHAFETTARQVSVFADDNGPGVLTADRWRGARLWRRAGSGWRPIRLAPAAPRFLQWSGPVTGVAMGAGECFVGYGGGTIGRFDARTGAPSGPALRPAPDVPGAMTLSAVDGLLLASFRDPRDRRLRLAVIDPVSGRRRTMRVEAAEDAVGCTVSGRPMLACIAGPFGSRRLQRCDAETGAGTGAPILAGWAQGLCAYRSGGRTLLAVGGGRQIHRFDAETGAPAGPPLYGHRRAVLTLASCVIDGRAVLFSADGATVRRWDAGTGVPWPVADGG